MNARLLFVPALVAVAAFGIWRAVNPPFGDTPTPACTWRAGTGTDVRQGGAYDELPAETPLRLSFSCSEPRHVYVFSHSAEDGTLLAFPSPDVQADCRNPLPAGNTVLPGRYDGKELAWTSRAGVLATQTLVCVAAREPVPELEALGSKVRRWSNAVFADRSMQVTKPAGVDPAGAPRTPWADPLLARAADLTVAATMPNGPMTPDPARPGVWYSSWRIVEKKGPKAQSQPPK